MRVRALVVAAALVGASAATVSAAPSVTSPGTAGRAGASTATLATGAHKALGLHRDDFRSAAALRAARMRVLAEHRLATASAGLADAGTQPVWGYGDSESALPDVDGDGVGDILSSRLGARTPALKVLSGRTGRTLWSAPSPTSTLAAIYVPAPGGKSEIVLLTDTQTGEETPAGGGTTDAFTASAVNPKTGAPLWSTTITGVVEDDPTGVLVAGVGEFDGVLMRKGTTPYLLLDRITIDFGFATVATSVAPVVIDATNGSVVHPGAPVSGDDFTFATPVGDLNGDGTDDYLVCVGGDVPTTSARSGVNGQPLWTTPATSSAYLVSLVESPDFSGDHHPDLLLGWDAGNGPVVHGVDGSTGSDVWTAPGDFGVPVGDIDHDGRSDTQVEQLGLRSTFTAISGKGKRLWSRDVLSPSGTHDLVWSAGDVDGDNFPDTYVEFDPEKDNAVPTAAAMVSGRTGIAHGLPDIGWPLGTTLRTGAPSFVRGVAAKKGFALTAYDGRTHRAFWHTTVRSSDIEHVSMLDVVSVGHGRVALLALLSGRFSDTVALFDGTHGTLLWKTSYDIEPDGIILF